MEVALNISEIRIHIGQFLDKPSILSCIRVCKTWHETLAPLLWPIVTINGEDEDYSPPRPSFSSLEKYKSHVRQLNILGCRPQEVLVPTGGYTRLTVLRISGLYRNTVADVTPSVLDDLIQAHTHTLQWLELSFDECNMGVSYGAVELWNTIGECQYLEGLELFSALVQDNDTLMAFWKACLSCPRLSYLALSRFIFLTSESAADSFKALETVAGQNINSTVQELIINDVFDGSTVMQMMEHCPDLREVTWECDRMDSKWGGSPFPMDEFHYGLAQSRWPALEKFHVAGTRLHDTEVARCLDLMGGMKICPPAGTRIEGIRTLSVWGSHFGQGSCQELLRMWPSTLSVDTHFRHADTIVHLNLGACRDLTAESAQKLLENCPNLEFFQVVRMEARNMVQGQPWVCLNLRFLTIEDLVMSVVQTEQQAGGSDTHESENRNVMKVFARLVELKSLKVVCESGSGTIPPSPSFEFRMDSGLASLATLTKLTNVTWRGLGNLGQEDVEWICQNLPSLKSIHGRLHEDQQRQQELARILDHYGIALKS